MKRKSRKKSKKEWEHVCLQHKIYKRYYGDWEYNGIIADTKNGYRLINVDEAETKYGGEIKEWQLEEPNMIGTFHNHPDEAIDTSKYGSAPVESYCISVQDSLTFTLSKYNVLGVEDGIVVFDRGCKVVETVIC